MVAGKKFLFSSLGAVVAAVAAVALPPSSQQLHRRSSELCQLTCPFVNSRQAIKKYIRANNDLGATTDSQFSSFVNRALTSGEEQGHFSRPKGM